MAEGSLEILLRRDRVVVAGALAVLTALAWAYVLWLAFGMRMPATEASGMPMGDMGAMLAPSPRPWSGAEFLFVLTMWAVMMVGMMTPAAAPMILIYARVARQAALQGHPFAPTGWFASGYLLCWIGFALIRQAPNGRWSARPCSRRCREPPAVRSAGSCCSRRASISSRRSKPRACRNASRRCSSSTATAGSVPMRPDRSGSGSRTGLTALDAAGR